MKNLNLKEMSKHDKVKAMFKDLRKEGFTARMSFMCCRSCAWSKLGNEGKKDNDNIVFFSSQSSADDTYLYLSWSGNAEKICKAAEENGLLAVWNGEKDRSIMLIDINDIVEREN